jgi:hypothetical protein
MMDMKIRKRGAIGEKNGSKLHRESVRRVEVCKQAPAPISRTRKYHSGESHHKTKLTALQVQEIRHRYSTTRVFQSELAREFGVSQAAIWYILKGKNWKCSLPSLPPK